MATSRLLGALFACASVFAWSVHAQTPATGHVFHDTNNNADFDVGETGIANVAVSNGRDVVRTDPRGRYSIAMEAGRTLFVIKPAGWRVAMGAAHLPLFWRHHVPSAGPTLRYGGIAPTGALPASINFPLRAPAYEPGNRGLDVLVFGDPQPKSMVDVGYYTRDIIEPLLHDADGGTADGFGLKPTRGATADLGLSLGDIVHDDLSLYPALNAATARLGVPWLHAAGNHDLDFDAKRDEDSLLTFRDTYGPDTFAWEETDATFVVLDDVVYQPGQRPAYIGGLREDQFAFLASYLPTLPKNRLLVLAVHVPFFNTSAEADRQTFRVADRERLFDLLKTFPHVLLLSAHSHTQRHVWHGAASGWHGATPLHEYNVGAACGAFWSGLKDASGIPDATMADGTPNGHAMLKVEPGGGYALAWHPARDAGDTQIALHAPQVLRQGAYPAFAVYANVYMGHDDSRVDYRIDGGDWRPMLRTQQPDPLLVARNVDDDRSAGLRSYDRAPLAEPSTHLWRGTLPTGLAIGEHAIEVRVIDSWRGQMTATTTYRLATAEE